LPRYGFTTGLSRSEFSLIMFYVYLLQNDGGRLYTGYTADLKKRFKEHNQRLNFSTKHYGPWKIIYYEACMSKSDAKRREMYLKTTQGKRFLKIRIHDYLQNKGRKNLIN